MAALEGKAATTPITMQDLANRIANLEKTANSYKIITLNRSGNAYPIPSEYQNYNFEVITGNYTAKIGGYIWGINKNNSSLSLEAREASSGGAGWSKSGSNIVPINLSSDIMSSTIKVLFYK